MVARDSRGLVLLCMLTHAGFLVGGCWHEREPMRVHYSDVPGRVQIIGKLGHALGELVTVRGQWTAPSPAKPALPRFIVYQVNGCQLEPPVEFDDVEAVLGSSGEVAGRVVGEGWELRGVETGGFVGFSDRVWEEAGVPPMQRPPRGFLTRFCYVKATRTKAGVR